MIFSNKTSQDVFLHEELKRLMGNRYADIVTRKDKSGAHVELKDHLSKKFAANPGLPVYVCGPPGFMDTVQQTLTKAGASQDMVNISF